MKNKLIKIGILLFFSHSFHARSESLKVIEANPLLLINQGIGINSEYQYYPSISIGGNFEIFNQTLYNANSVSASRKIYTLAPKLEYYFLADNLYGPFAGLKINFTYSSSIISDSNMTSHSDIFYVAPILQVGYRFISQNGFTMSAYIGAGIKSTNNNFPQNNIPPEKTNNSDWQNAVNTLNKHVSQFQPDYGLTLGYIF